MDYHIKLPIWEQIFSILQTISRVRVGSEDRLRRFVEAIGHVVTTGCQWRRLPAIYGCWRAIHRRFKRWSDQGIWHYLFERSQSAPDPQQVMVDATIIRAHACRARYKKNTHSKQSVGRSYGGLSTKIHACVDAIGNPLKLILTPGQEHESLQGEALLEGIHGPSLCVLGDKGYDCDRFIAYLKQKNMEPVIPPRRNRKILRTFDKEVYKERHLVECFFSKIKQFRRISSRYEKIGAVYLSFLHFVCALIWMR